MRGSGGSRRSRTIGSYLAPYDLHSARRVGAAIISVFAISLFIGTLAVPIPEILAISVGYLLPAVLLASAALLLKADAFVAPAMCGFPLVGVALTVTLNLTTSDASAGAQVAFCAPVMFAASQLRPAGAVITLVAALAGEIVVVARLKDVNAAITDAAYVSSTLMAIGLLLIFAARRQNRLLERLEQQATVDPLTGLVTRRVLDESIQAALSGAGTAMVLIDVDHFKTVNDTYGHPVGDDALTLIAGTLRALAGQDAVVSRLGGDEMAVLLPGCDLDTAVASAQAFVDGVRDRPLTVPGQPSLPLSISAGIGYAERNGLVLRELYAAADASLYDAKRAGRGRVGQPELGPGTPGTTWGAPSTRPERQHRAGPQVPAQHRERGAWPAPGQAAKS